MTGDPDRWVQFVEDVINAFWPRQEDPGPTMAKICNGTIVGYGGGKYVTAQLQTVNSFAIAGYIDAYFQQVLGAGKGYGVDVTFLWI